MARFFKYTSIKDADITVTLLSNSPNEQHEDCYIQDLLVKAACEDRFSRFIFTTKNEIFVLYTAQVAEAVTFSVGNAVSAFEKFVDSSHESSISIFYNVNTEFSDTLPQPKTAMFNCLAILSRMEGPFFTSMSLPIAEAELLKTHLKSSNYTPIYGKFKAMLRSAKQMWNTRLSARLLVWSAIIALGLLALTVYRSGLKQHFHQYFENGIWVRYDLKGSEGPRYQLKFTHHNVSNWASTHAHNNNEWALRIDDQAMIPAHLMDEEELRYQRWFQERYYEKNQIRLKQDYISEAFLSDPDQIQVPSDMTFHMAHCVRALRRYWNAKETGKHICPRDIDYRHMKHCLDSLDEWAFPDGERGSVKEAVDPGTWRLIWETKVCFWVVVHMKKCSSISPTSLQGLCECSCLYLALSDSKFCWPSLVAPQWV